MKALNWGVGVGLALCVYVVEADEFAIQSFDSTGTLIFNTLSNGTNYNYQVEWAPSAAGPWSTFNGAGALLPQTIAAAQGSSVTCSVPMCFRVVASLGDYLVVDLSGGTNAVQYPVIYYRSIQDVPGGPDSDAYKTTNLLMRMISRGVYLMGSPEDELGRDTDELPHQVTLTQPFYMGVFEVTQKQWERVMGTWPSYYTNASFRDSRPVERVSYDAVRGASAGSLWPATNSVDATSFMGRLRARTGQSFDLPTEAQWEYAGRAGTISALNSGKNLTGLETCTNVAELGRYFYNGGSNSDPNGTTAAGTAKVGSYLAGPWGLFDIHGNVWELCRDWYGLYSGAAVDPVGYSSGLFRVSRGGGWDDNHAYACRSAFRFYGLQTYEGSNTHGFRIALP